MVKPYVNNIKLRSRSYGKERRRNLAKEILYKGTPFPKTLEYEDIDNAFTEFVDKELEIEFEGNRLPTFSLYSNQRFSEYFQTWEHTDENLNLLLNFKTVKRENNPKPGENQGGLWNIPGERLYTMAIRTVMDDNGTESYERYAMKQPYCVDLIYRVNIVTNRFELLNRFNQVVNDKFKSRQCYIRPNGHFIPMVLDDISDESEYSIEDRKFFSQSYMIKVMAYIIRKEDLKVEKFPKRILVGIEGDPSKRIDVSIDEPEDGDNPVYENKRVDLSVGFPEFMEKVRFTMDSDVNFESYTTENVRTLRLNVDGNPIYPEKGFIMREGDDIRLRITKFEIDKPSKIVFHGYYPDVKVKVGETPEDVSETDESYEIISVE